MESASADAEVVRGSVAEPVGPDLVTLLQRLPAADRDALLLVVWGELSYEEAASAMGVPVGTVRSRIARARSRLSAALGAGVDATKAAMNGDSHA